MPRKHKRVLGSRPYANWSNDTLNKAIEEVKSGVLTLRGAEEKYKIPKSTIQRKNKGLNMGKIGRPTELDSEEENCLIQALIVLSEWGTPFTTLELRLLVKAYLDAKGQTSQRFASNMPGVEWCYSFLERHKTKLSHRLCANIKRARAEVSKEDIKSYFENLENTLIGVKSECIVNYDETNVSDDPGRKKVLARHGSKRVDRIMDFSKTSTSVMFAGTASGKILPPYIVYKSEHLHSTWISNGPPGTRFNRSRSGWFDHVIFEDWFNKILLPYFQEIDEENRNSNVKVVIGDNLSSHISLSIIQKCEQNNICFIFLPPNSTHLCQPLDVAVFKGFKQSWRNILTEWKLKHRGIVSKDRFPGLLKKALTNMGDSLNKNIIAGFKACGIYPFDPQAVLKKLPSENHQDPGLIWSQVIVDILKETRQKDAGSVKIRRSKLNVKPGESVTENHFNQGPSTSAREIVICSRDKDSDTDNTDNDPMTYVDPLLCSRDQDSDTDDDYIPPRDSLLKNVVENISADLHNVNENKENNNPLLMDAVEHSMLENISEDLHKINNDDKENLVGNMILQYRENDFILLKLDYNINLKKMITKFFIAKVKQVTSTNYILCKFMRASTKTKHTFIFPEVDDEMVIEEKQIVRKLLPPEIRRGRHLFKDIDGVTF